MYMAYNTNPRMPRVRVVWHINTHESLNFVQEAERAARFSFDTVQSHNGQEFSSWFTWHMGVMGIAHRHSRVRMPNDNSHIERFNRTLEEECLDRVPKNFSSY